MAYRKGLLNTAFCTVTLMAALGATPLWAEPATPAPARDAKVIAPVAEKAAEPGIADTPAIETVADEAAADSEAIDEVARVVERAAAAEDAARQDAVAAEAGLEDLWTLFQEAVIDDPRILAAASRRESGSGREREAFGQLLPQISASASASRTLYKVEDRDIRELYNGERYALGLTQVIYDPETWYNYRRYSELARGLAAEYDATLEEATVDLVERYFMALAAEDELELVKAERRATQRNLDRVQSLFDRQLARITDVLEISARVDALVAAEIEARNKVEVSREALSELVGRQVTGRLKRIGSQASFTLPVQGRDYWVDLALESNPALKARQSAVEAALAGLRQARAGHLPSVSANLTAQRSDIGYENSTSPRTDTYVAGLGVRVPIYSGGSTSARVYATQQDLMTAEHELEAVRRQVIRETRTAFYSVEAGISRINASRKALDSAEKARIATERSFGFGVTNAVDVLNTVKEEYAARRDLLRSQYDYIMSLMVLRRWSGTLAEEDVRKTNEWLVAPDVAQRP